jgi:cystathionine gamma-synthase
LLNAVWFEMKADLSLFSFPYTDTLKILQKFGPGCIFYGLGEEKDIDALQANLESGERYLALFCECPSNPLLKTPNLRRLRALADQYDFLIIVDETIGNFANICVLEHADIVVSSLTKVFSGDSNVMGGRYVFLFLCLQNLNSTHLHLFPYVLNTCL